MVTCGAVLFIGPNQIVCVTISTMAQVRSQCVLTGGVHMTNVRVTFVHIGAVSSVSGEAWFAGTGIEVASVITGSIRVAVINVQETFVYV